MADFDFIASQLYVASMGRIELVGLIVRAVVIAVIATAAFWLAAYALRWFYRT